MTPEALNNDDVQAYLQANWMALTAAAVGVLVVILLLVMVAGGVRRRRRAHEAAGGIHIQGRAVENMLTLLAAAIATGVAATGMWRFFSIVLQVDSVLLKSALFAFLEVGLVVEAIRARRNLLDDIARLGEARQAAQQMLETATDDTQRAAARLALRAADTTRPSTGVDGNAVWGLAALSGVFASFDARSFGEAVFRLAAPLVAAWLWERGLAALRRRHTGKGGIHWKITPERVFVKLGMAEATGRAMGEIDAERRRARLVTSAYRLDMLRQMNAWGWRISYAARRLRRQIERFNETVGLSDRDTRAEIRLQLAILYQAVQGMSASAVQDLAPWSAEGTAPVDRLAAEAYRAAPALSYAGGDMTYVQPSIARPSIETEEYDPTGDAPGWVDEVTGDRPVVPASVLVRRVGAVLGARGNGRPDGSAAGQEILTTATVPVPRPVPAQPRVNARGDMKASAWEFLDTEVKAHDPRSRKELAQLLAVRFGAEITTATRYVTAWRTEVRDGRRPTAVAKRLRLVPDEQQ